MPGTVLLGRYIIGQAIGSGGFGIIYKAWDTKFETIVARKEYFPKRLVTRAPGTADIIVSQKGREEYNYRKSRFLAEARTMAKFGNHKSIPNVFEVFDANGSAYIVMELLEGMALNSYIHQCPDKRVDMDFAISIINEIGKALISLHEQGIIHRDVAPDNIYICSSETIKIKLLDLGSARLADSTDDVIDIILKPGYSPVEQYDKLQNIGPYTDVYALGATLYYMLTGVKPDESTNRKIQDTVVYPREINSAIGENLSNAIMKAMAIEKHLRFRTVEEFLRAVNGEKKVVTLAKEKKLRKRRRATGIIAAVVALVAVGAVSYKLFSDNFHEAVLDDASITVWYSEDSLQETTAMKLLEKDFEDKNPNVDIELVAFSPDSYEGKLIEASKNGKLPDLFESTGIASDYLSDAVDVGNVLSSKQRKECLFLEQYDNFYSDKKKLPLGINVPMVALITNGDTSIGYYTDTFSSVNDFRSILSQDDMGIAADSQYNELISKTFDTSAMVPEFYFMTDEANKSAVMVTATMRIDEIKSKLTKYQKNYAFSTADKVNAEFVYEWSIGASGKNELRAAETLLSWMLGASYQDTLMISSCHDGQLPVNKECFKKATDFNEELFGLRETYKNLVFEN